jgi:putative transcriptional regulator
MCFTYRRTMKNRIRDLRESLGWTQQELATRLGVTRQTVLAIENDKYNPTLALAFKLGAVFARPIEEIFDYEPEGGEA